MVGLNGVAMILVGALSQDDGVVHGQGEVLRSVHLLLDDPEDPGADEGQDEVEYHGDGICLKEGVVCACRTSGGVGQLRYADDGQDAGILDVDDQVVADLGHDVPEGLGQDHAGHGLEMVHADGHGSLCLARIDGQDTASYGLRHVGAGVDGDDEEGCRQHTQVDAEYIGQSVVDEGCLDHHGGAAEDLHIGVQDELDDHEDVVLCRVLRLIRGDRLDDTHRKADHTSDKGGNQRDQHGIADALHKGLAVGFQDKQDLRDKSLR